MARLPLNALSIAALLACLGLPLFAHEDDPKVLDRQPPVAGSGLRTGVPAPGTRLGGSKAAGFASDDITLLSWLTLGDLSGAATSGNDCWGYTSPSGREYALVGVSSGTAFVEITDPNNPQVVSFKTGPTSLWRDIKTFGTHAYCVSEGGSGIQVFDMVNIDAGSVISQGTVTTGGDVNSHNVVIDTDSGYLYRTGGGSNGLRIYDLNGNPAVPALVGTWSNKYVHDAQVVTYTSGPQAGKQIAFCCSGFNGGFQNTGLSIVDVTNKANPIVLKEVFWAGAQYSHQVWLSQDLKYAYLNDELDENGVLPTTTYVIDVQNPATAFLVGSFTNGNTSIGHNVYTTADRLFEANYRSGVRVFDIGSSATNPSEVAWFDTYPDDDGTEFNGLWNVYPFFPSGVVIGSDLERGLFVWWVGPALLDIQPLVAGLTLIDPAGDSLAMTISEAQPGTLVPGTAKLHYDAGAGLVTTDLVAQGGNNWTAIFPALPCGTAISYYVSAQSTNGLTWNWPEGGPSNAQSAVVALNEVVVLSDMLESASGWTVGAAGDNATTGIWTRVNPVGTAAQPEDDHSNPGTQCFVTGQGLVGGGIGDNDVDGGTTTLVSPAYDLSALNVPQIGYWRWYSNNQNSAVDDTFVVQVSNGGAWVTVETIGPIDQQALGGWYFHQFAVADFVTPNATVQVRFRASDLGAGSIVEAAVDDLQVTDLDCNGGGGGPTIYCNGKLNSQGCIPEIYFAGTPSETAGSPFTIGATLVVTNKIGLMFYGLGSNNTPFQGGILCAASPIKRLPAQNSGGSIVCEGAYAYDFNATIQGGGDAALVAGQKVNGQFWYRDPSSSFGSGLSNAVEFIIQP